MPHPRPGADCAASIPQRRRDALRAAADDPQYVHGNPENPLSDDELRHKYRAFAEPALGVARALGIERRVDTLAVEREALPALVADLLRYAV